MLYVECYHEAHFLAFMNFLFIRNAFKVLILSLNPNGDHLRTVPILPEIFSTILPTVSITVMDV